MQQTTYPLTSAQMGMYYEWQKDKELTQYNNPFLYRFPDQIDAERLKAAFRCYDGHFDLFGKRTDTLIYKNISKSGPFAAILPHTLEQSARGRLFYRSSRCLFR